MTDNNDIQEPLRSLVDVMKLNKGNPLFGLTLENIHSLLSQITLNKNVPATVKQQFETAKNLSLYSCFVYRFHQVAELISFVAVEMALRERYLAENPFTVKPENSPDGKPKKSPRPPTLTKLLKHAQNNGWIENSGFSNSYELAYFKAEEKNILKSGRLADSTIPIEPTNKQVDEELENLGIVSATVEHGPGIRNNLAHGSTRLDPGSVQKLRKHADIINQIYSGNEP
jgi:hypothetical protein